MIGRAILSDRYDLHFIDEETDVCVTYKYPKQASERGIYDLIVTLKPILSLILFLFLMNSFCLLRKPDCNIHL